MGALNRSLRVVQAAPASHFDRSAGCLREIHSERLTGHCFLHPRAKRGGSCPTTDPEITEKLLRCLQRLKGQNWVSPIGVGERVYFFSMRHGTEVLQASDYFEKLTENPPLASGRLYGVAVVDGAFLLRYGRSLVKVVQPVTLDNTCAKRNTVET